MNTPCVTCNHRQADHIYNPANMEYDCKGNCLCAFYVGVDWKKL